MDDASAKIESGQNAISSASDQMSAGVDTLAAIIKSISLPSIPASCSALFTASQASEVVVLSLIHISTYISNSLLTNLLRSLHCYNSRFMLCRQMFAYLLSLIHI